MASTSIDLEAQRVVSQPPEVGATGTHEKSTPRHETLSDAGKSSPAPTDPADLETQPAVAEAVDGESEIQRTDVHRSERDGVATHVPAQTEQGMDQAEKTDAEREIDHAPASDHRPVDSGHGDPEREPQEIRMIGDFDGSANALWGLYRIEAQSYDSARIQSLKDDMDGVLIFAGLFSAALTSFVIDSKQNLKVDPADKMVFYLQQNVVLLAQISQQISTIAPQIPIPSPPPPYPDFSPSSSDIRVNVYWFMSLVFSLSAALLAILVQQWVRDYMHVFQRYSDPLKSARLRQYLHEGCEKWYMPVVAGAVPGLLHLSLFLFFLGLGDFVLSINTTVGLSTAVPIGFIVLLYIFTVFAPVIHPQSPYQNPFSALIWYLIQKMHGRQFKDRGHGGASKSVSPRMSQGQMQLAMEESGERKGRDERAIRWLVENLTEETEMERFVVAIPGSFNAEWGIEVWKRVSEIVKEENKITNGNEITTVPFAETSLPTPMPLTARPSLRTSLVGNLLNSAIRLVATRGASVTPTDTVAVLPTLHSPHVPASSVITSSQGENVVRELSRRVAHLLGTCKHRGLFASDEQWRKRTRACIETTASLVGCANADLGWFGNVGRLLGDIGDFEKTNELWSTGTDRSFVIRWICLSIMAIRPVLNGNTLLQTTASNIMIAMQFFQEEEGTDDEQGLKNAQKIDDKFKNAWACLERLFNDLFRKPSSTDDEVKEILRNHEAQISELEHINVEADRLIWVDQGSAFLMQQIDEDTHGIIHHLPGVQNGFSTDAVVPFSQVLELFIDPHAFTIIAPGRALKSLSSLAPRLRSILEGEEDAGATRETLKELKAMEKVFVNRAVCLLQRQMWRLEDLRDGGGLGLTVEIFFFVLRKLLSTSSSKESQSSLYVGTFRAITSDWRKYKHSLGTQKILLDAVASDNGIFSHDYPTYITDEFLVLTGDVLDGETGPHIEEAAQRLREPPRWYHQGTVEFRAKALEVILQSQVAVPGPPPP